MKKPKQKTINITEKTHTALNKIRLEHKYKKYEQVIIFLHNHYIKHKLQEQKKWTQQNH